MESRYSTHKTPANPPERLFTSPTRAPLNECKVAESNAIVGENDRDSGLELGQGRLLSAAKMDRPERPAPMLAVCGHYGRG